MKTRKTNYGYAKRRKRRRNVSDKKKFLAVIGAVIIIFLLVFFIFFNPFKKTLVNMERVEGIDVSNHQGEIDWKAVSDSGVIFAYLKATEGSTYVDSYFEANWKASRKNDIATGAYHFFNMKAPGIDQAKLFAQVVPKDEDALPPVIDLELEPENHLPKDVRQQLSDMIVHLKEAYGKEPIIYLNYNNYHAFVEGHFPDSPIWISDISNTPDLGERSWVFWQYTHTGTVPGIEGDVDQNIYVGDYFTFLENYAP